MAEATCAEDVNSSCWRVSAVVRQYDPVQVAESVHLRRNAANSYLHHRIVGSIDVFGVTRCRSKYRAVAGDATEGIYLYRPFGMAHGSNTDSATVAW